MSTRFGNRLNHGVLGALMLALSLAFAAGVAHAQEVTVTDSQVYRDRATLILDGPFGEDSEERYVRVRNQSSSTITVSVHTHSDLDFVWFRGADNREGHEVTFSLPPQRSLDLGVHAYLRSGTTTQYHDDLGFDVTYGRGGTAYVEVPLSAYIYHPTRQEGEGQAPVKPPNYHALKTATGQPKHCHLSHLPLKVYSNHRAFGVQADFDGVFLRALNVWNAAAQSINLGRAFFEPTTDRSQADIVVDWSGNGLGPDHLGVTILQGDDPTYIVGIVMRPPGARNMGETVETLCQELGHLLGLEHSEGQAGRNDLMYGTAHGHIHPDLSEVSFTDRDRQMLRWLYSRTRYAPILSSR